MTIAGDDNAPCGTANRVRVSRNHTDIKKINTHTECILTFHLYLWIDIEGELGAYWKTSDKGRPEADSQHTHTHNKEP